jgi:hypothetical protein
MNGCTAVDSVTITVNAPPTVDAGNDLSICPGQSARLVATGSGSFAWTPATGLDCIDCQSPVASPASTTTYHVTLTSVDGCMAADSVTVHVQTTPDEAFASIDRDHRVLPGHTIDVPVTLDSPLDAHDISHLRLKLGYSPRVLRLERISTTGTLLDGWSIDSTRDVGIITLDCTAPLSTSLRGTGTLAVARFRAFVGDSMGSELPLQIEVDGASCLQLHTQAGLIALDSICGLSYRLIESYGKRYALDEATPNPFNPTATIGFELGLDGPARLVVINPLGEEVAVLVDGHLEAGSYEATWDAGSHAAGLYYYRLTSGSWSRTGTMVLRK